MSLREHAVDNAKFPLDNMKAYSDLSVQVYLALIKELIWKI